jgi:hypothetical protein
VGEIAMGKTRDEWGIDWERRRGGVGSGAREMAARGESAMLGNRWWCAAVRSQGRRRGTSEQKKKVRDKVGAWVSVWALTKSTRLSQQRTHGASVTRRRGQL